MAGVFPLGRRGLLFLALSLAAFAAYAPRVCRTVSIMGDSAELVTAAVQWGVPHPPGYPLYTTLAHLFTFLPSADVAHSIHGSSAVFHALTVGTVACIIDVITGSLAASIGGALCLAMSGTFFSGSLYAEVFPLGDLLFAILLLVACALAERADAARVWICLGIVVGLGLSHHHMIVLAFPASLVLLWRPARRALRERPGHLALAIGAAIAIPAACYGAILAVAARAPLPSWGDVRDFADLARLVLRQDYGGPLHASRHVASGQLLERLDAFAMTTAQSFGAPALVLAIAGAAIGLRRWPRAAGALLLAWFASGPLFAAMNTVDIHSEYRLAFFARFASMSHVAFGALAGIGIAAAETLALERSHGNIRTGRIATAVATVFTLAPLVPNLGTLDLRSDRTGLAYAHDLVLAPPDDALILLKSDAASQAALYVCAVEKRCGDRVVLSPGQLWMPWKRRELERRYPGFALPPKEAPSAARWLVEQNATRRPVFVHPELVDEAVRGSTAAVPSLLLFRAYPHEAALRAEIATFRAELRDIATGARCEGCVREANPRSPAAAQLGRLYDTAIAAHRAAAIELGLDEEAKALAPFSAPPSRRD